MFNNHCIIDGFYTQYYRIKAILFLVNNKKDKQNFGSQRYNNMGIED